MKNILLSLVLLGQPVLAADMVVNIATDLGSDISELSKIQRDLEGKLWKEGTLGCIEKGAQYAILSERAIKWEVVEITGTDLGQAVAARAYFNCIK